MTTGASTAFGVFAGDRLLAFASYEVWDRALAHMSVVTHPEHRGRGFAKTAVAQLAQHALISGLIPQYRTLVSNKPSLRVAAALGFHSLATSVAALP